MLKLDEVCYLDSPYFPIDVANIKDSIVFIWTNPC